MLFAVCSNRVLAQPLEAMCAQGVHSLMSQFGQALGGDGTELMF